MNGKGILGLILMKCGFSYNESLDLIDQIEVVCKKQGYSIVAKKDDEA